LNNTQPSVEDAALQGHARGQSDLSGAANQGREGGRQTSQVTNVQEYADQDVAVQRPRMEPNQSAGSSYDEEESESENASAPRGGDSINPEAHD